MNNKHQKPRGIELDLKDLAWKLLMQWKAILLVCLLCAVILPAAKYINDMKAYKAAVSEASQPGISMQEAQVQIDAVLAGLSEDDRLAVEHALRQGEWLRIRNDYLNDSILMNLDPFNVNSVFVGFQIVGQENQALLDALYDGYYSAFDNDEDIIPLKEAVSPDSEVRYIRELVFFDGLRNAETYSTEKNMAAGSFHVLVALPDDADDQKVINAVKKIISNRSVKLSSEIGPHEIKVTFAESEHSVNYEIITKRTENISWVNNFQPSQKNFLATLSDTQYAAYTSICTLQEKISSMSELQTDASESILRPSVSKRVIVLSPFFGLFMYIFFYTLLQVMNGRINCASLVDRFSGQALIGEIYSSETNSGIAESLISSKSVAARRFKDIQDPAGQPQKLASALCTISKNNSISDICFLILSGRKETSATASRISEECSAQDVRLSISEVHDDFTVSDIASAKNAVLILDKSTKTATLEKVESYAALASVNLLGAIFVW